ncbi:MAG: DinB family protein [Ferruginibacter sp.]
MKKDVVELMNAFSHDAKGKWGKMNVQQMIEHVTDFFDVSTNQIKFNLVTPEEHLPKYKGFLMSDKEFRENTKAPESVLGDQPVAIRNASLIEALDKLQKSINDFFEYFQNDPLLTTTHPVFGPLNFEEWALLHYKHVVHHLKQFGSAVTY